MVFHNCNIRIFFNPMLGDFNFRYLELATSLFCVHHFGGSIFILRYFATKIICDRYFAILISDIDILICSLRYFATKIICDRYFATLISDIHILIRCLRYFETKIICDRYFATLISCTRNLTLQSFVCLFTGGFRIRQPLWSLRAHLDVLPFVVLYFCYFCLRYFALR